MQLVNSLHGCPLPYKLFYSLQTINTFRSTEFQLNFSGFSPWYFHLSCMSEKQTEEKGGSAVFHLLEALCTLG